MIRKAFTVAMAAVMAVTVWVSNPQPAEARRGAGLAVGVAAAVLGAALIYSATRPRYRYRSYQPAYAGYYYAQPRYYYAPRRVVVRRYYAPRRVVVRRSYGPRRVVYRRW